MARVGVPVAWVTEEPDELPRVCVLTGRAADRSVAMTLAHTPSWTWVLLPFGVLPFVVAGWFTTSTVHVRLPVEQRALARLRRLHRAGWAAMVLGLGSVLVGGLVLGGTVVRGSSWSEVLLRGGAAVLALGVVLLLVRLGRLPSARQEGARVVLGRTHRGFAEAVGARQAVLTS